MKKIAIFIVWFGELPNYFELWKNSVIYNQSIDFYFVSDQKIVEESNLISIFYNELGDLKREIENRIEFKICLKYPYKICDYKPMIGYLFEDILAGYDYWGYCDLDMIFGDIRKYLSDKLINNYDKIFNKGHLTLYKNDADMRELFKTNLKYTEGINYKEAYRTNLSCYFDEHLGMERICEKKNLKVYKNDDNIIDIIPGLQEFIAYNSWVKCICEWDKGKLYCIDENKKRKECLYVHFQKRKFDINLISYERYYIVPNIFTNTYTMNDYENNTLKKPDISKRNILKKINSFRDIIMIFRKRRLNKKFRLY